MVKKKSKKKKVEEVEDTPSGLVDLMDTEPANITVIYGLAGTGKTTLLGTFPKPMLVIDVGDRGIESLKSENIKHGDIDIFRVNDFDDMYDALDLAQSGKYKTVGIDHLTSLQDVVYNRVMSNHGVKFMHQQYYSESSGLMKDIIGQFNELADEGIHPVYLAQQRDDEVSFNGGEVGDDEDELIPSIVPAMQPAVATMLMAKARILVQTHIQAPKAKKGESAKIEYRLRTGASPYFRTKITRQRDKYPCPQYIVDPTWDKLQAIIKGEYTESTTKKKKKKKGSK